MTMIKKLKVLVPILSVVALSAQAQEESLFQVDPSSSITAMINIDSSRGFQANASAENLSGFKTIKLMHIIPSQELSEKAEYAAAAATEIDYSKKGINPDFVANGGVDLGMGAVPVLDQGQYGTCVTFASTAVLDAAMKKGDYVDQQCSLELNLGLGHNYWDGANKADEVILPLQQYGVVPKGKCDVKYPSSEQQITVENYQKLTVPADQLPELAQIKTTFHSQLHLDQVKKALNQGTRVAMGFFLKANSDPISVQGFNVKLVSAAKGTSTTTGGLWACRQGSSRNYCGTSNGGHEVIVIGYDDKQQLLKIRNSWDTVVGDHGNFYMTYAFFNSMGLDGTEVK